VETHGSDVFYQSLAVNRGYFAEDISRMQVVNDAEHNLKYVHFPDGPKSRASSLGASTPGRAIVRKALDYSGGIRSVTVSDEMAMQTLIDFAGEQNIYTQSCGQDVY
jgi:L-serine/L-threonine ammonia-lyase